MQCQPPLKRRQKQPCVVAIAEPMVEVDGYGYLPGKAFAEHLAEGDFGATVGVAEAAGVRDRREAHPRQSRAVHHVGPGGGGRQAQAGTRGCLQLRLVPK